MVAFQRANVLDKLGIGDVVRGQAQTVLFFRNPAADVSDYEKWNLNPLEMAFIKGSDEEEMVEVIVFPKVYNNLSNIKKGDIIKVDGKVEKKASYQIIANAIKQKCAVPYGTYIILRYLNEMFGFDEILIKVDLDNSFTASMYQLLNLQVINKTAKKKIWWSPDKTKWHIDKENPENYIPFYFSEQITYKYPIKK